MLFKEKIAAFFFSFFLCVFIPGQQSSCFFLKELNGAHVNKVR